VVKIKQKQLIQAHSHTHTHTHTFLWPGRDLLKVLGDNVIPERLWRYMGGTDPIRTLGMQAKVSQVTNTYAKPGGMQTELYSPHSISEQGLDMHVFHRK